MHLPADVAKRGASSPGAMEYLTGLCDSSLYRKMTWSPLFHGDLGVFVHFADQIVEDGPARRNDVETLQVAARQDKQPWAEEIKFPSGSYER